MSRRYNMGILICDVDPNRVEQVKSAATQEWPSLDDWYFDTDTHVLTASGEDNLCGGEGEEEFADRLAHAIWAAHGSYCEVTVAATYLEELPYEEHVRDAEAYDRWAAAKS